jgi:uncharacterized protein involved in exopolysaccharide biosynthesis
MTAAAGPALRELETPEPAGPESRDGSTAEKLIGGLRLLWVHRRRVIRRTLAGLAAGTLFAFALPKQYQSTVQLMPPDNPSTSATMLAALSAKAGNGFGTIAGDLLGGNSTGVLFIGILRSRTLEDRLVERFDLKKEYGLKLEEDARWKLSNRTGISEDHRSGIISLSVVDHDRARARAMAQAYVEELTRLASELSTSAARRERVFLEDRLQVVKRQLDQASGDFSQFASQNAAINIPEQAKAMVTAAAALQGQLIAAESQLKGLSEIYTANNVRVRSAQARVSELRRQLEAIDGDADPARHQASPAGRPAYPTIRQLPLLGVAYADLLRRTKIQEAVYETLTQQYELAKVQEAKETPSVKVLDAASLPERKVFPPRLLIIFWGGLLGLAGAAVEMVGGERWRQLDSRHPGKLLAREAFQALRAALPSAPASGERLHTLIGPMRAWFAKRDNRSKMREAAIPPRVRE